MVKACSVRIAICCTAILILAAVAASGQSAGPAARKQTSLSFHANAAPKPLATRSTSRQLEPRALEILRSVRDRLAAAHTLSFVAVVTSDARADEDSPRIENTRFAVTLKRPNQLRALVFGDAGLRSQVNCNGRTMLTYTPAPKAISLVNAPPTVADCLKHASGAFASDFPVGDLIGAMPSVDVSAGLQRAHYVGRSQVGGTDTDVVAFTRDGVLAQIWVGTEDRLPRAIRISSADDPNRRLRTLTLSDWQIDVAVPPEAFSSLWGISSDHPDLSLPRPVGTSGIQSAGNERPLTIHSYGSKYWGAGGSVPIPPGVPGYYASPDGYDYYPPPGYGFPPGVGDYGMPCYDCGEAWPEGAPVPGFNLSLSTSGWYQPESSVQDSLSTEPFWVGQIVSRLPVGCAAPVPGPAFYLCGDLWFAGIIDADGNLRFRVIGNGY